MVATHPAVQEVGVAGIPDGGRGDVVAAWVVVRRGMKAPTMGDLKMLCQQHLAPYKVAPRHTVVEALPKSAIGKILRRQLPEVGGKGSSTP